MCILSIYFKNYVFDFVFLNLWSSLWIEPQVLMRTGKRENCIFSCFEVTLCQTKIWFKLYVLLNLGFKWGNPNMQCSTRRSENVQESKLGNTIISETRRNKITVRLYKVTSLQCHLEPTCSLTHVTNVFRAESWCWLRETSLSKVHRRSY